MEPSTTQTDRKRENLYFVTKVKGRILPGSKPFARGGGPSPPSPPSEPRNDGAGGGELIGRASIDRAPSYGVEWDAVGNALLAQTQTPPRRSPQVGLGAGSPGSVHGPSPWWGVEAGGTQYCTREGCLYGFLAPAVGGGLRKALACTRLLSPLSHSRKGEGTALRRGGTGGADGCRHRGVRGVPASLGCSKRGRGAAGLRSSALP